MAAPASIGGPASEEAGQDWAAVHRQHQHEAAAAWMHHGSAMAGLGPPMMQDPEESVYCQMHMYGPHEESVYRQMHMYNPQEAYSYIPSSRSSSLDEGKKHEGIYPYHGEGASLYQEQDSAWAVASESAPAPGLDAPVSIAAAAAAAVAAGAKPAVPSPATWEPMVVDFEGLGTEKPAEPRLEKELQELKRRLQKEQAKAAEAEAESKRLREALKETSKFVDIQPDRLRATVQHVMDIGWKNITWRRRYTALHLAAECGNADVMPLLVKLGADPGAKDSKGRTAKDIAEAKDHPSCVEMLVRLAEGQDGNEGSKECSARPS